MLSDIGSKVIVYNGYRLHTVRIVEDMLWHKVGEFVRTKKLGGSIHKLKKQKKNKTKK
jgi:ribosomal protein S19